MRMPSLSAFSPSEETLRQGQRMLRRWLGKRLSVEDLAWLDEECKAAAGKDPVKRFYMAFSAACRHAGKEPLDLTKPDRASAERIRPGWAPAAWTEVQAGRITLLLHRDPRNRERWLAELDTIFGTGDLEELVALYQALPILPHPESLADRCTEGVRSNMTDVFRAVAHGNPYPSEFLTDAAWNQLVLKALFVEIGIEGVVGLEDRGNPALARMLCDYARERWAAKRPVPPELWRCVGPHADEAGVKDLERALDEGDGPTKAAAADALRRCPWPEASWVLSKHGFAPREE